MEAGSGASCGTCAICLQDVGQSEEAFLDACFHHFHLQCVRRWVAAQRERAGERSAAAVLACPLCRQPFESAIFDCEGGAYRREYFSLAGSRHRAARPGSGAGSLALTAAHRRRRAVYTLPLVPAEQAARAGRVAALTAQQAQRAAVEEFVARELQALLLQEDVQLVAQHVLGTLSNAVTSAAGPPSRAGSALGAAAQRQRQGLQPRRPLAVPTVAPRAGATAASPAAASPAGGVTAVQAPPPELVQRLQAAAAPFVFEHAERFAWEIAAFAAAGTATVAAYDRLVLPLDAAAAAAGGMAARRQLEQQPGPEGQRSDGHSGSGSWAEAAMRGDDGSSGEEAGAATGRRSFSEPQRSDSEGYLELLLQQGAAGTRQQGPGSLPAQQRQEAGDCSEGGGEAAGRERRHSGQRPSDGSAMRGRSRSRGCSGSGGRSGQRRTGSGQNDGVQISSGRRASRRSSSSSSSSSSGGGGGGSSDSSGNRAERAHCRRHYKRKRLRRPSSSPSSGHGPEPGAAHAAAKLAEQSHTKDSEGRPAHRPGSEGNCGGSGAGAGSAASQAGAELAVLRQQALRALLQHQQRSRQGAAGEGKGVDQQLA